MYNCSRIRLSSSLVSILFNIDINASNIRALLKLYAIDIALKFGVVFKQDYRYYKCLLLPDCMSNKTSKKKLCKSSNAHFLFREMIARIFCKFIIEYVGSGDNNSLHSQRSHQSL